MATERAAGRGAKQVFEGLTWVTVGFILLANTTGYLPWSVWWTIAALWPLLVVALGIDILGRAVGSGALRVVGSLVVIGGLIFGALAGGGRIAAPAFGFGRTTGEPFSFTRPHDAGVTSGSATIDSGLAVVRVKGGAGLATASGVTPFGKPTLTSSVSGPSAEVRISSSSGRGFVVPAGTRSSLDVTLDDLVTWQAVKVDAGASDVGLDLSDLDVRSLEANVGLSSVVATFGDKVVRRGASVTTSPAPGREATFSGGLTSFRLRVSRSLGVELRVDNGLGSISVPAGWTRVGGGGPFSGTWHSDGYDSSASKLRLVVHAGLSSVDVERY